MPEEVSAEGALLEFVKERSRSDVAYEYGDDGFRLEVIKHAAALGIGRQTALEVFEEVEYGTSYGKCSDPPPRLRETDTLEIEQQRDQEEVVQPRRPETQDLRSIKEERVDEGEAPGPQARTLREVQHQETPAPDHLLKDILPATGAGVLSGPPKVGKSLLARMLALSVADATAELFLGRKLGHGGVLYCDLENDVSGFKAIIRKLLGEADGPDSFRVLTRGELQKVERGGLEQLRQLCMKYRPKLVVLDTYACFRTAPSGQSLYDADYNSMDTLRALGLECGCFILVLHHTSKRARGGDPAANLNATHGLGAAASVLLEVRRAPGSQRGTLTVTGNMVPSQKIPLSFDPETLVWGLGGFTGGRAPDKLRAAKAFLLEQLKGGPCRYDDLFESMEEQEVCSLRTLMSAKTELGIISKGKRSDTWWEMPE